MLTELYRRETLHGFVLVMALPHYDASAQVQALVDTLRPEELRPLERAAARRQVTYAGGRFVLRRALQAIGVDASAPIIADERGAPVLPPQVRGSISHKDGAAAAIVCFGDGQVGIDIEQVPGPSDAVASKILTDRELTHVTALDNAARALELALRFSAKEAIYKALDPYVRRYVAYDEVETWPATDGTVAVWSNVFPPGARVSVAWEKVHDHVLTTARINV